MDILYLLIPISLLLLGLVVLILIWAVGDGQFDDLEGPAHRILMDEDKPVRLDIHNQQKIQSKRSRHKGTG
jgi:cbb3-type cytochrome oxidase maturation protein